MSKYKTHFERRKAALEGTDKIQESKTKEELVSGYGDVDVIEELAADVNGDGVVDADDLKLVEEAIEASDETKGE